MKHDVGQSRSVPRSPHRYITKPAMPKLSYHSRRPSGQPATMVSSVPDQENKSMSASASIVPTDSLTSKVRGAEPVSLLHA